MSRVQEATVDYSLVVPIYDEEAALPALYERLAHLLERLDGSAEVILVDDGSQDDSFTKMVELSLRDPRFKVLQLSRNFGQQAAITAGIDFARGNAVIIMDADLQDPPELVLTMAERWREGFEVVYAVRRERRGERWSKRLTAALFYRVLRRLSDVEIPGSVGDFRLVDRKAVDAYRSMRESDRFVRGMFSWIGFKQIGVPYERAERVAGETKYPLSKMVNFALDGIVGFSKAPLRFALGFGFVVSVLAFLVGFGAIVVKLVGAFTVPGWASLFVVSSFLGGVQLIVLGVVGEYVGRIYEETKRRPLYIVNRAAGLFDEDVQRERTFVWNEREQERRDDQVSPGPP